MKFSLPSLVLLASFAPVTIAALIPLYIVLYPPGTSEATKKEAKSVITKSGGLVLYDYENFNGIAATIPSEAMDKVKKLGNPTISADRMYHLDAAQKYKAAHPNLLASFPQ
ncbi:hypothetical protein Vi05172_g3194 [Venturia inaequalis]|nr:hypothetical protein Vi05172_g3194 [Venturia inaequalis]